MAQAPGYREWQPAGGVARHLVCTWAGRLGAEGTPADQARLTREGGRLGGVPPSRLVPRLAPAA